MKRTKQIIISILAIFVLAVVMTSVYAEEVNVDNIEDLLNDNTATEENTEDVNTNNEEEFENIPEENTNVVEEDNNISIENNMENDVKDLPNSGLDTTILVVIAIFGLSAIYAYKKIKDYNIK